MLSRPYESAARYTVGAVDQTFAGKVCVAVAASLFVALCAHVSLPLLLTPVPLTLGNFAVLLVGLLLGPRLAFAALVLYLAEGASGLPVFNPGGLGGVAQLLGPTAGYLFAYPFAAALAGWVGSFRLRFPNRLLVGLCASLGATGLILLSGLCWLMHSLHLSAQAALVAGLIPFLPGEALKIIIAAGLFQTMTRKPASEV